MATKIYRLFSTRPLDQDLSAAAMPWSGPLAPLVPVPGLSGPA
jgi:hypothetical protein